jgi:CHAT domain-containing protein
MIPAIPGLIEAQTCQMQDDFVSTQQCIGPEDVLLEYSVTDSSAIIYANTGDSILLACQSLNPLFWMSHKSFRRTMKSADRNGLTLAGQILYLYLIKPVQSLLTGKSRLIIKPDDRLSDLPFEALIRPDDDYTVQGNSVIRYLVQDYEVIYRCNQVSRQEAGVEKMDLNPGLCDEDQFAFLGFSPVFCNHPGLNELPDSRYEIAEIGSLFRQRGLTSWLFLEEYSGKEYFKSLARRGKIIHLSTHYITETSDHGHGGFLFWGYDPSGIHGRQNEEVLTMEEIAGLHLQADLIVLNACASGIVKLKSSGPQNSLPAIFLQAGAQNILSTLWNVTDRLAGEFMVNFYRLWLSGKTYSQALREVKLQMISSPETALPTIWAPYVLTAK